MDVCIAEGKEWKMIQIDWKDASAEVIGHEHGITLEEMATTLSKVDKAHRAVL